MLGVRFLFCLVTAAALGLAPTAARAQESKGEPTPEQSRAREVATQGIIAFKNGEFEEAACLFDAAHSASSDPNHLLFKARSLIRLGDLVDADQVLTELLDHHWPQTEPDSRAREVAQQLRDALALRIPRITVEARGASESPQVFVNGQLSDWTPSEPVLRLDPGQYELSAKESGGVSDEFELSVAEYDSTTVVLRFLRPPPPPPPPIVEKRAWRTPVMWSGYGLAAVGIAGGTITGLRSWRVTREVRKDCFVAQKCGPSTYDRLDQAHHSAFLSNVFFSTAVLGITVGTFALITSPTRERPRVASRATPIFSFDAGRAGGRVDARWDF